MIAESKSNKGLMVGRVIGVRNPRRVSMIRTAPSQYKILPLEGIELDRPCRCTPKRVRTLWFGLNADFDEDLSKTGCYDSVVLERRISPDDLILSTANDVTVDALPAAVSDITAGEKVHGLDDMGCEHPRYARFGQSGISTRIRVAKLLVALWLAG